MRRATWAPQTRKPAADNDGGTPSSHPLPKPTDEKPLAALEAELSNKMAGEPSTRRSLRSRLRLAQMLNVTKDLMQRQA